ncbi:CPW-WPC family protein, putative [Plasmodium relictum]|uniref:CPW-WPC family protein, putative n=1 Tax=Plasmodium relictum TaxID=85471 RepID=A0A1J1H4S7_PLARL|nr:CPW-WPC family protein, putative [Plasmodium relictum]CRG99910.1 CPW-WPC family protein, putative [Plasmodium relictum]
MKKVAIIFFFFFIGKVIGIKIYMKRKYPNVENGVYQLDNRGRPIKIVDVNYEHIWEIPKNGGVNTYAVVKKNGEVKKFSEGTNIIYGTTKRIKKENTDKTDKKKIKKEIEKYKKTLDIKNVSNVSKKEDTELKKKKEKKKTLHRAIHITADDVPSTEKEKEEDEDEINIGKELGVAIRENFETHYEESKNPSSLSTDLLDTKIPGGIEKLLMDDLEDRKWISKKPLSDKICLRDYSKQCPSTWERISEVQCRSPKEYSGPCSHIMVFEPMTSKEKSQLATDCKVNWLCINESCGNSKRDYSKDCPENWNYTGKCEAPENYSGGCNKIMDFGAFTQNEKEEFSSACKVVWPCKEESCERDYSITCPKGWSYDASKDMCKGSKEFEGLISKEEMEAISHMSYHQRIAFSSKYGIAWPCKNKCTYGYDIYPCPRGWINLMNSGACKAPDDYNPPISCPRITHFDYMNINEKEKFSKKCNVKWLCIENAQRDYSKCPIHFDYIDKGNNKGMCKPNEKYKGPCKEVQDILSLTLEQKYNFEETCEAQFHRIENKNIPQVKQDNIPENTMEKLLKGTDISKSGITLE